MHKPALLSLAIAMSAACTVTSPDDSISVEITSPVPGHPVGDLVRVSADAVSAGGSIAKVQFDLPNGVTITDRVAPFATTWDSTTVPDGSYVVRATAIDDYGAIASEDVVVTVANARCSDELRSAQGLPRIIPDGNPAGIASAIQMLGSGRVASLSLSLDISHRYASDLYAELISPSGRSYPIALYAGAYPEGIAISDQVITAFNGERATGAWNLLVMDTEPRDVGTLDAWSLAIAQDCRPLAP